MGKIQPTTGYGYIQRQGAKAHLVVNKKSGSWGLMPCPTWGNVQLHESQEPEIEKCDIDERHVCKHCMKNKDAWRYVEPVNEAAKTLRKIDEQPSMLEYENGQYSLICDALNPEMDENEDTPYEAVCRIQRQAKQLENDLEKAHIRVSQTRQDMQGFQCQLKRRNDQVAQLHSDLWDLEQILYGREFKADGLAEKHESLAMRLRAYAREERNKRAKTP